MNSHFCESQTLSVTTEHKNTYRRLDQFLTQEFPALSRKKLKDLFEKNLIYAKDVQLELKKMPPENTQIHIQIPQEMSQADAEHLIPEDLPLDIIYEDEDILIINKPVGMIVHPGAGNPRGTLVNALIYHFPEIKNVGQKDRPGIVHRIDKGTSGLMVIAKSSKAYDQLISLFSEHRLERKYQAICLGRRPPAGGTLKSTIARHPNHRIKMKAHVEGGKEAITHYRVLNSQRELHHIECTLETGRTHQIRVHMTEILKVPLLCDPLYANPSHQLNRLSSTFPEIIPTLKDYKAPLLHAKLLSFEHPNTGHQLTFEKEPPHLFQKILERTNLHA